MKRPRIIVLEPDGRLADRLAPLASERKWTLRECRRPERCDRLLQRAGKTCVVVRLNETPTAELGLLARVAGIPEVRTVAVGGPDNSDLVCGLACDVGADFALFPPMSMELLPKIVSGLMDSPASKQIPKQ